jgi:alkylation response protein AidB-like acyl-CoA dehydrogenase
VGSVHDAVVASGRLARGDASLAIGVNMHLVVVLNLARRWRMARVEGNARRERAFGASLRTIASGEVVMAAAMSERGQDLTRPDTTAVRTEAGWRIDGHKIFCTMSPAATVLLTSVGFRGEDGSERYGYVEIPATAPGVTVNDDWDALGMRASGSQSVSFEDVHVPVAALRGGFATGDATGYLERNLGAGLFHAAVAMGIAEGAQAGAVSRVAGRAHLDPHTQMLVAENIVELSACRAVLSRSASLIDEHHADNPTSGGTDEELTQLFAEAQSAKLFIGDAAVRIVDRALAQSGGSGYLNGSPLARAYRDVRAMPFMHPLGANRAHAFLAELSAGREPMLH